jgi:hypothetical protein
MGSMLFELQVCCEGRSTCIEEFEKWCSVLIIIRLMWCQLKKDSFGSCIQFQITTRPVRYANSTREYFIYEEATVEEVVLVSSSLRSRQTLTT